METFADASRPSALSFRFLATEGELLHILIDQKAGDHGQLFVEIFELPKGQRLPKAWLSKNHLEGEIVWKVTGDGLFLLRIQAEMLINLSYRLQVYKTPSLAFPVHGKDRKAIMSFFGAPRDGGSRKHKRVDIFADKGTPILAAADGRVNLRNGGLGGKTVWQRLEDMSLYYAHLDSQYVRSGQQVKKGDTLGTVGNTGNAKHTPPHLHFGIYIRNKGAINPLAYIDTDLRRPEKATFNQKERKWEKIAHKSVSIKQAPDRNAAEWGKLAEQLPVFVKADLGKWAWISDPDGHEGFVESHQLTLLDKGIKKLALVTDMPVYQKADSCAAILGKGPKGLELEVFAESPDFYLTKHEDAWGWIRK